MRYTQHTKTFLHLIWRDRASRLTGSLCVIFILLGVGISATDAAATNIALWVLATICGGRTAYSVWLREHNERLWYQNRIYPSFVVSYDPADEECDSSNIESEDGTRARCIRLRIENIGTISVPCRGFFTIRETPAVGTAQLCWIDKNDGLVSTISLVKGVPRYLQIFSISESNRITPTTWGNPPERRSLETMRIFEPNSTYMFNVAIKADDYSETVFYDVVLEWTGDWQTAFVRGSAHS